MANYSEYVQKYPDLMAHYNKNVAGSGKTIEQWGKQHWDAHGHKENRSMPASSSSSSSSRFNDSKAVS